MQLKSIFKNWSKVAALLLVGGAIAWTIKLGVIVSTNGQVIDTGAAALFMKTGLILLGVGSTGVGHRLSRKSAPWLRTIAMLLSPALLFGTFLLFAYVGSPLFKGIDLWYAQQEAPIALAVVFYMAVGLLLYKNYKPAAA